MNDDIAPGLRIGRFFGIPIHLHPTWFVVFVLVIVALWNQLAANQPGLSPLWRGAAAAVTALLVFASILMHEIGHCVLALRHGVHVRSIVLFVFGGVAWMENPAPSPRAEFQIALAGPAVSAALGALFALLTLAFEPATLGHATFLWLSVINVAVAVFNLLPGYPLDGGRVLRALLWAVGRDPARATRTAARVGQVIAYGLVALGALLAFRDPFQGIWLAFIGWFVLTASLDHRRRAGLEIELRGIAARDLMKPDVPTIEASTSIARFADDRVFQGDRWAVVLANGSPTGLVSRADLDAVPRRRWAETCVGDITTPMDRVVLAAPELPAIDVLHLFSEHRTNQIPIMEGSLIVGAVTRQGLLEAIETARRNAGSTR